LDEIEIASYIPAWPAMFKAEAARLRTILPADLILDIQHYGSTAVPGLDAKPIIDILLATPDLADARAAFPMRLKANGYAFWADNPKIDRLFFVKGLPPSAPRRTHHLHVTEPGGELWRQLSFRDHLRGHPPDARAYAAMKHELAVRHRNDRDAYTNAKADFIHAIMDRASAKEASLTVQCIEHAQLAMPRGEEDKARAFYEGVLGLPEVPKPADLAKRGGCWFEAGGVKLHLGVEDDFRPAKKAHVALVVSDLDALLGKARAAGCETVDPTPFQNWRQGYVFDLFGNRLELLEAL
jgi:GrpB-like predicted nucleotidyltransferase (UPF0157 family)/catechol 2,3-dioxygenase-like lactoylglutathione lyase family enzyme